MLIGPAWVTWPLPELEVDKVVTGEEERDGRKPVGGLQR